MGQTTGWRWPHKHLNGDNVEQCRICWATWPLSELRRDASGAYVCPNDWGKDALSLDRENRLLARKTKIPVRKVQTGGY